MAVSQEPVIIPSRKMRTNVRTISVFIERSKLPTNSAGNAALQISWLTPGSPILFQQAVNVRLLTMGPDRVSLSVVRALSPV